MLKQYLGQGIRKLAHFRYYYSKQQIILIRLSAVVCFFSNILSFLEFLLNQRKKKCLDFLPNVKQKKRTCGSAG